ncbi:MAG: PIG-L family deacetylase [Novosphingobium sp.]|jgi:hypothetical protein|nr:PIG-L family deacetylase [Novosphingobium sp.]
MAIFLSPHHDDICFSLAGLAERTGGDLVNIFTISDYVAAPVALPADPAGRVAAITALRRQEDIRFAAQTGLARHDLALAEPPIAGLGAFEHTRIDAEVALLSERLVPFVLALARREGARRRTLYCPMGIGGHRNHLSVLLAVRRAIAELARACDVRLYEDLHYASHAQARQRGLARARLLFGDALAEAVAMPLDPAAAARKLDRIALYASQQRDAPRHADFTPASGLCDGPHEIVWPVAPPCALG